MDLAARGRCLAVRGAGCLEPKTALQPRFRYVGLRASACGFEDTFAGLGGGCARLGRRAGAAGGGMRGEEARFSVRRLQRRADVSRAREVFQRDPMVFELALHAGAFVV